MAIAMTIVETTFDLMRLLLHALTSRRSGSLQLSRADTVIVAHNLIRNGAVMEDAPADDNARAAQAFNASLAAHPRLESTIVPIMRKAIDGMSISIVKT